MKSGRLIVTAEEHHQLLLEKISAQPKHIIMSSFGLYAGIGHDGQNHTEYGKNYRSMVQELFDAIMRLGTQTATKILIGVPDYRSCKGKKPCIDCEINYAKVALRILSTVERYKFSWKYTTGLHLKCNLFFYQDNAYGITGGRNLTGSDYDDVSLELSLNQIDSIYKVWKDIWSRSLSISDVTMKQLLDQQGITDQAIAAMTG